MRSQKRVLPDSTRRYGYELHLVDLLFDFKSDIRIAGDIGDPALLVRVVGGHIQFIPHSHTPDRHGVGDPIGGHGFN